MTDHFDRDEQTDEALVVAALADSHVFGVLIDRYQAKLLRYVMRISGVPSEDAEDICQEVFLKVYRNLRDFDTNLSFSSWIYRITHNETRSYFRKHKKRIQQTRSIDSDDAFFQLASDLKTDGVVLKKEEFDDLRRALEQLKPAYREILTLHFLEEKSYKEISDILRKPMGSIATQIHRAKAKVRDHLTLGADPAKPFTHL